MQTQNKWIFAQILLLLAGSASAKGRDKDRDSEDSIVDGLEEKLLEDETKRTGLQGTERSLYKSSSQIEHSTRDSIDLHKAHQDLGVLEADVAKLASKVDHLRQNTLRQSATDSLISLSLIVGKPDEAEIQSLNVKLDGYTIYELDNLAGKWFPQTELELMQGPIDPGNHNIKISARVGQNNPGKVPLQEGLYHFVSKSFDTNIPAEETTRGKWTIKITVPNSTSEKAEAKLIETSLE